VALESLHAVTYFARPCRHALRDRGLVGFWTGYFAARAAPLGRVGAGPVAAAFFNFEPGMVADAVPGCWKVVDPAALTVVRAVAGSGALGELCSPDALGRAVGALPRLRIASSRCSGAGRILTGVNRALWASIEPELLRRGLDEHQLALAEVWQACTTLREHRGDGHVAALVAHGLGGCEAHVLAAAADGIPTEVLRDNRGWSRAQWEDAAARLSRRGLLRADGAASDGGLALRGSIEVVTDVLAEEAYASLADDDIGALYDALVPCARELQESGLYPFPNPMGLPQGPFTARGAPPRPME
jgi:hypothetical protein